jgi:hypothetical protein
VRAAAVGGRPRPAAGVLVPFHPASRQGLLTQNDLGKIAKVNQQGG